jgi:Zn-dependent peptidase ImmA (M78 family)
MHEIGHIVLDHTEHSQLAEAEANFFAQYMLAPTPTLQYFLPLAASKVSFLYNISEECAKNVIIQFKNWKEKGEPFLLPYEKTLLEHLHFIPVQEVRSSI